MATTPDPEGQGTVRRLWTRSTLLYRTDAAREVGDLVDLPGHIGEVIDWLARSLDLGHRHGMVEEILAMRRIRAGSLSSKLDADRSRGYLFAVHNAIERRKALAAERKIRGQILMRDAFLSFVLRKAWPNQSLDQIAASGGRSTMR